MTDFDQLLSDDAAQWNAARPPALRLEDQLAAALAAPAERRTILKPILAAAAVAAVVTVLVAVGLLRDNGSTRTSAQLSPITGVVWQDPNTVGTIVYTPTTIRVYDGCTSTLAKLEVHGRQLSQGSILAPVGPCGGTAITSPAQKRYQRELHRFDTIAAGPATWTRHGTTLSLHKPGTGTLHLTTDGRPAPQAVGSTWRLTEYVGTSEQSHSYHRPATLHITSDGRFTATGTCETIRGTAKVSYNTIKFTSTDTGTCPQPGTGMQDVVQHLLNETADYTIAGTEFILNDRDGRQLDYQFKK